ncbi:MAG TPA: terminase large subunit, partial [Clostridia bacterium]|nr:terminase large subunit [Clostridia bacterium]
WISKETKLRRFREGLILVAAGNGKSTMVSGNATYGMSKDGERGAEVYCLANSKDQAKIVFGECCAQIEASPTLVKHFRVTNSCVKYEKTNSVFKPLASDSKALAGLNVHMAIFDELQDYKTYRLINTIKAKCKKRRQPLVLYISTFGDVIDGPLFDYYVLGGNILDGSTAISQRAADRMFIYIDEIDEGDDPDDPSCWGKANPSLGVLLDLDDLIDEWERCKAIPAERSHFINQQLNVFTDIDEMSFLDAPTILKNNREIELNEMRSRTCYGGFDLSESEDLTSACLEFPLANNDIFLLEHTWVPEKKVKIDREKLDWRELEREGLLTIVPGTYVRYEYVLEWFLQQRELYKLESIGIDPAKAFNLVLEMQKKGFILDPIRQGELTLTAPLDDLKELFLDGHIIHNNNRLFTWYLRNVKLTKRSAGGTYLPTKQNKNRKIDGFACFLNAHTEYLRKKATHIPEDKSVSTIIRVGKGV